MHKTLLCRRKHYMVPDCCSTSKKATPLPPNELPFITSLRSFTNDNKAQQTKLFLTHATAYAVLRPFLVHHAVIPV